MEGEFGVDIFCEGGFQISLFFYKEGGGIRFSRGVFWEGKLSGDFFSVKEAFEIFLKRKKNISAFVPVGFVFRRCFFWSGRILSHFLQGGFELFIFVRGRHFFRGNSNSRRGRFLVGEHLCIFFVCDWNFRF